MARDPWDVLGVAKSATDDEIKRAFKKQARVTHPDKKGGSESAFKEVNEAYQSIKDAQSRQQYQQEQMGGFNFRDMKSQSYDFSGTPFGGMHVDLNEFMQNAMGGMGFGQGFKGHQEPRFQNRDINVRYSVTLSESHAGVNKMIKVKMPSGEMKAVSVDIPKGVDTGHKIRYNGLGESRYDNAPPGDLYINITVKQDDHNHLGKFRKQDKHLETTVTIDPLDAMLGCDRTIQTFSDGAISLKIHPGTQHGTKMRVPEHGTYTVNDRQRGDLLIEIKIQVPEYKNKQDLFNAINSKVNK